MRETWVQEINTNQLAPWWGDTQPTEPQRPGLSLSHSLSLSLVSVSPLDLQLQLDEVTAFWHFSVWMSLLMLSPGMKCLDFFLLCQHHCTRTTFQCRLSSCVPCEHLLPHRNQALSPSCSWSSSNLRGPISSSCHMVVVVSACDLLPLRSESQPEPLRCPVQAAALFCR